MSAATNELVLRFISSIGRPSETAFYLSLFQAERRESFALIAVADAVMRQAAEALVTDLRLLAQLGLTPIITIGVVQPSGARAHAEALHRRLREDVACDIVDAASACACARSGSIPLVPFGNGSADTHSVDERFDRLAELATAMGTRKVIFLGRRSGLQPLGEATISLVDLTTDYQQLSAPGLLPRKQTALLAQVRRLIDSVAHRMTVSVTSPLDLLRELFTMRGAGTMIRRGSNITSFERYADLDRRNLEALIEASFASPLPPSYFDRPVRRIYLADDYRGAAIVTDTTLGPYLSKFAVEPRARGEGVGRDLWRAMSAELPSLFWRSRPDNDIDPWYQQSCEGMLRDGRWNIYWRGLKDADIPAALRYAREAPSDFPR